MSSTPASTVVSKLLQHSSSNSDRHTVFVSSAFYSSSHPLSLSHSPSLPSPCFRLAGEGGQSAKKAVLCSYGLQPAALLQERGHSAAGCRSHPSQLVSSPSCTCSLCLLAVTLKALALRSRLMRFISRPVSQSLCCVASDVYMFICALFVD